MGQLENRFLEAATVGDVNVVKKMLADGIDVDVRNEENRTALMRCTRRGRKQVTQLLLDAGADVNAVDDNLKTPIMGAAKKGHEEVVEMLIDAPRAWL